jgi:sigma-B regulation protein RsbU (phosphoserine phosphatase)
VVFTDGVVEAVNDRGEEFDESRLVRIVSAMAGGSAADTLQHLTSEVDGFVGGARQRDDITWLIVRAA